MLFKHNDFVFEIIDEWWAEAGMIGFVPNSRAYRVAPQALPGKEILEVHISEVIAPQRALSHGVFNDDSNESGLTARERVSSILRGFLEGAALPPVEIVREAGLPNRYRLTHGAHRFYLSVAAGFSHVPAVHGFLFEEMKT